MTSYSRAYERTTPPIRWRTVTFTIPWELHLEIQEIVSQDGEKITKVLRELLTEGVESRSTRKASLKDKPKIRLLKDLNKVRERHQLLDVLAELRDSLDHEEYLKHCQANDVSPHEVDAKIPPGGMYRKRTRCRAFLRVLFYDRPKGLPVNEVIKFSKEEGFGSNMVRDAARDVGLVQYWDNINGVRTSMWRRQDS